MLIWKVNQGGNWNQISLMRAYTVIIPLQKANPSQRKFAFGECKRFKTVFNRYIKVNSSFYVLMLITNYPVLR